MTVYAEPLCRITDGPDLIKECGRGDSILVDLPKLSADQRLGMDQVTHYMDVDFIKEPRSGKTSVIELFYNSPAHVAYIQHLDEDGQSLFYYVNTRICGGRGANELFEAWKASEAQRLPTAGVAENVEHFGDISDDDYS